MMIDKLVKLRRLAEAASPGPWSYHHHGSRGFEDCVLEGPALDLNYCKLNDAAYLAAVSPDVLLALLDVVEAAAEVRELVSWHFDQGHYPNEDQQTESAMHALTGALAKVFP